MPDHDLPPAIYLPSTGGHTSSRFTPELVDRVKFPFRRWSIDQDGNMVVRTRVSSRDARARPYERHTVRFSTASPRHRSLSLEPEAELEHPSPNTNATADLLKGLASALQDPESFETSASTIFSTHRVEPSIASALMQLARPKQETTTSSRLTERAHSVGPSTSQQNTSVSTSLTPFKQERPFPSGSPGVTSWYSSSSLEDIEAPPPDLRPQVGDLYVHSNRAREFYDVWLYGTEKTWRRVTFISKVHHPTIMDRVLSMRANGAPSWITAASYTTIKGRKEKSRT